MMKKNFVWFLAAFVILVTSSVAGRADQFTDIQNSPYTYWVPPAHGYAAAPPPYYGAPPPPYYYGPAPGPVIVLPPPRFFFGFHFH